MKGSLLIAAGLLLLLGGCQQAGVSGSLAAQGASPRVAESLRVADPKPASLSQALETLVAAFQAVEDARVKATGTLFEGLAEASDYLDGAGEVVAEQSSDPTSISSLEDALSDIESAVSILDSLAEQANRADRPAIQALAERARLAASQLESAVSYLRG